MEESSQMSALLKVLTFFAASVLGSVAFASIWQVATDNETQPQLTAEVSQSPVMAKKPELQIEPSPAIIDPDGFWLGELTVDPTAPNTIYCKTVVLELVKIGRLPVLYNNPTCAKWMPNPKYYEQDAAIRAAQQ
jgi:hypothetical protein